MPLLDRQRRGVVLGQIRIGTRVKGTTREGKPYERPARLDTFRLTSPDRAKLDVAAELYGGEVKAWSPREGGAAQWEVTTTVATLAVRVPPGEPVTQDYMLFGGRPVVRQRLCDGFQERMRNVTCLCPPDLLERKRLAVEGAACRPTTRVSLILADLPGLGIWTLTSRGDSAADELGATAESLRRAELSGVYLPAALRLEIRESRGSGEVHTYAVPVLDVGTSLADLEAGRVPQIGIVAPPTRAAITARAEPPPTPTPATPPPPPTTGQPGSAQECAEWASAATTAEEVRRLGAVAREQGWFGEYVRDAAGVLEELESQLLAALDRLGAPR